MALWSVNLKILGKANQAIPARSYTVLLSQMDIPAALLLLGIATAAVIGMLYLFFRNRTGLRHPGDRLQPWHEPGAGHQYRRQ